MLRVINARRALVLAVAISLLVPLVPLSEDGAEAQPGVDLDCGQANDPLWIRDVQAVPTGGAGDDLTVTGEQGVFAKAGVDIEYELRIENRISDNCSEYMTEDTDRLRIQLQYLDGSGSSVSEPRSLNCDDDSPADSRSIQPGEYCETTISLSDVAGIDGVQDNDGEQRVRFLIWDDGANTDGDGGFGDLEDCGGDTGTACTAAERVIVVNQLPDMFVDGIEWVTPPEDRRTTYTGDDEARFAISIRNEGGYPNWNPNGARGDDEFAQRSAFDGNGDNIPDERPDPPSYDTYHWDDDTGPVCNWLDPGGGDPEYRCSYRYGAPLETPIRTETRTEADGDALDVNATNLYSNRTAAGNYDKDFESVVQPFNQTSKEVNALDRFKRAGQFFLRAIADEDLDGQGSIPESNENNNWDQTPVTIHGVDLEFVDHNLIITNTGEGSVTECSEQNPCPVDAEIKLRPEITNSGDDNLLGQSASRDLRDHSWRASIWFNGQRVERLDRDVERDDLDDINTDLPIPKVGQTTEDVWDQQVVLDPEDEGGEQTLMVRLDHPDNYATPPTPREEFGEIGEHGEHQKCGRQPDAADNTWCIDLVFEDKNAPNIENTWVDGDDGSGQVPQVQEGDNVTFEAEILNSKDEPDGSLKADGVKAVFEHPNGTPATFTDENGQEVTELPMERNEDDRAIWSVNATLHGEPGRYVYKVHANDTAHMSVSDGLEFDLASLPTEIEIERPGGDSLRVNGETYNDADPPRYRGTADEPENWLNITASINGTGHSDADVANNTSVELVRPNGTTAAWLDVEMLERCVVETVGGTERRNGSACDTDDTTATKIEDRSYMWYYADTRDQDVDLDWVGPFNVTYHVSDKFGRNATDGKNGEIADRLNENGEERPMLSNVSVSPTAVDPGDEITARADAADALRVENVSLEVRKPGAEEFVEAPLLVDQIDDQTTRNGTYGASFEVGPDAPFFDRGGTYTVRMAATDFAAKTTRGQDLSIAVNDTEHPQIVDFRTIPNGTQEVGGPITWVADVDDDLAVQPPTLRIDRPTSGATGAQEMTYNETQDRWVYGPLNASDVDVGTWTYDVTVEDYTGKQSTASGTIQVEENLPPQGQNWRPDVRGPADGAYGPADPTIRVDVVDYGQGVNQSSVSFGVNGEDVTDDAEISPIDACDQCYRLKYDPPEPFAEGSTVDVTLEAADVSDPPQESDTIRHQFQVDAQGPTADLEMGPAVTQGDRRVIGLPTDIEVSVTDDASGPGSTEVTVTDADPDAGGASQTITLGGGEGTLRLQEFDEVVDGHGVYQIAVDATDAVGNEGDTLQQPVLFDQLGPSIEVFAEPGKPREVVFANVTEDAEIQKVEAVYNVDDGPEQTLRLEEDDGTWSVRLYNQRTDQAFQEGAQVRFTVEATDIFGNVRSSPEKNFTAGDSVPSISFDQPEEGATITDTTEVSWTASDAETPTDELRISLFYKKPGGTFQEIPDAQDIPNRGSYRLDTTGLPNGDVTLQVFVLDGQNFAADEVNVTVRNLGDTFSAPQLEDTRQEDGRDVLSPNQETVFRVQIDGNVRRAWANITQDDGEVVQRVELENVGGSTWEGSFRAPSERGDYEVSLSAVTDEGTKEAGAAHAFSVQGDEVEGDNFIPEWTLLTALTATAVALGALGLRRRWT